jgi:ParB-like nuclease domain
MSNPQVTKTAAPAAGAVPSHIENGGLSGIADKPNRRLELVPPGRLVAAKHNIRTHSKKQIGQITRSIERFGFIGPVLIDDSDRIIAGHARVEAAKRLGLDQVPILRVTHLSAAERKAYAIADNRLSELAGWNGEMLSVELEELREHNFDIAAIGFELDDVDIICNEPKKAGSQSSARRGSTSGDTVSRADDLWLLGAHQLRCGDADIDSYAAIDAGIRRWQRVAGKSAMLSGTGKSFAEIENERASTDLLDPARREAPAKREAA